MKNNRSKEAIAILIINLVINFFVAAIFAFGLGLGNAQLSPSLQMYTLFLYSLFIVPVIAYILRYLIGSKIIQKILLILSFSYFIWGSIMIVYVAENYDRIFNTEKYQIINGISISVLNIKDEGVTNGKRYITATVIIDNTTGKQHLGNLTLIHKKIENYNEYHIDIQSLCTTEEKNSNYPVALGKRTEIFHCSYEENRDNADIPLSSLGGRLSIITKSGIKASLTF